ncbi:KAP family P-loop NTPase fold protein [Antarcticirhabdus aurantiaca]|uniref:KAP family NTPase n=1 Tax=Antarcticirhabdus aurantiaca TaxID=2606717 RepID=A0ACD4NKX0_9HYPH|nr:KAP family NTPase [Antarcticirhabdus aurantiaca]WAJ27379.1 KAP family NTPase [Jeongeuplla avenae]
MSRVSQNASGQTSEVTADRPRTKLEEDQLGYRDFAEAIAAGLASRAGEDGLVIAVHGKWGSGKTSAVNMVVDALTRREAKFDENDRTIIVRFNPWWFSEQKDLTRAFFSEVNATIGKKLSAGVRDGLRLIAKKVTGATDILSAALSWTPAGALAQPIAEAIKAAGEEIPDERSLEEVRNDLAEALRCETRNIVVIIDDVDRLVADEVRQIFRLVKSVADLPRVTYLLVFDREIAIRALERPSDPNAPEWLEKIVQASFDLPPVAQTDLNRLFTQRLSAIVDDQPNVDFVRWGNIFHGVIAPYLRTPRDVGRLANAIAMAWPAVSGEVDVADFVAIETLRLFEPGLYTFIRDRPDDLTGVEHQYGRRESRDAFGQELLSLVHESRHSRLKRALPYIFPRLDAIFANTWHGEDWQKAERERRVSSRNRFQVYFNLGLGDGVISVQEIDELKASFDNPEGTRKVVQRYVDHLRRAGGTRGSVLLNTLIAQADDVPLNEAEKTARALLAAADLFFNPIDGSRTPEDLPVRWAVGFAISPILAKLSPQVHASLLAEAIEGPSLVFATYIVSRMSDEHGRIGTKEAQTEREPSLSLDAVIELERKLVSRIEREAFEGTLMRFPDAFPMIWAWSNFGGGNSVKDWIAGNLDESGFGAWLMKNFAGEGTSHSSGDMVRRRLFTVDRDNVSKLADIDKLKAMAEQMVEAGSDGDAIAEHFLSGLNSRF